MSRDRTGNRSAATMLILCSEGFRMMKWLEPHLTVTSSSQGLLCRPFKIRRTPKPPLGKVMFAERKCIKREKTNKQVFSYLLAYLKQTANILL